MSGPRSAAVALAAVAVLVATLLTVPSAPSAAEPALTPQPDDADVLVIGHGDEHGYHLFRAAAKDGWTWRPLASLQPGGFADDTWVGNECVTGDGRHVVAVVSPWRALNRPAVRDRGAAAFVVELASGRVRPLVAGVGLKYYTPGCGTGSQVALTRHLGVDQQRSEVLLADADGAVVTARLAARGQLTSAVPAGGGIIAVLGSALVRQLPGGSPVTVGRVPGQAFMLRATRGGADFLVADGSATAQVWRLGGGTLGQVGSGSLRRLQLFGGRGGRTLVVGADRLQAGLSGLRSVPWRSAVQARGASLDGEVVLAADPERTHAPVPVLHTTDGGSGVARALPAATAPVTSAVPPLADRLPGARSASPTTEQAPAAAATNFTTPKCAVPRNDQLRQVPQPSPARIDWALQLASRGRLTVSRPANFLNAGMPAYAPGSDFPPVTLRGGQPIPRSVIEAIMAQESNFQHASWHALPGIGGNPLISDYYGANGGVDQIDFDQADCGYGVGQVTDGMTAAATKYTANGKTKIALDYAANVAASLQVLATKWNQLYDAGITLNDRDPRFLENWYFAAWAYNSGLHPPEPGSSEPWGLGWTNNPMNADYPPNRQPFLRTTYEDAAHPGDWPYQEKVMGWMETPILRGGQPAYPPTGALVSIPARTSFCTPAQNACDPSYVNSSDPTLSYCTRADRRCWWHDPAVLLPNCSAGATGGCHQVPFTVADGTPEPAVTSPHPPQCRATSLPLQAVIVDDQATNYNVVGCDSSAGKGWSSQGSFLLTFGKDAQGAPIGKIDFHQLGAGFGGHFWFGYNYPASDGAHQVVGTWTPPAAVVGENEIWAFIPPTGNTTNYARYKIYPGDGSTRVSELNQHDHTNPGRWQSLGVFNLHAGAKVTLSNVTGDSDGQTHSIAFDALAFIPAAVPAPQKLVVLGDSYSAGEGLAPYVSGTAFPSNNFCHRSPQAYSRLLKPKGSLATFYEYSLGHPSIGYASIACSGAKASNVWRARDGGVVQSGGDGKTQLDLNLVDPQTTLVVTTIGGNDTLWPEVLAHCGFEVTVPCSQDPNYTRQLDQRIDGLRSLLATTFVRIAAEAPSATIVAMGYPQLFPPTITAACAELAPYAGHEGWFRERGRRLDDAVRAAAETAGVHYISVLSDFEGHQVCGGQAQWVNGVVYDDGRWPPLGEGSFHPNEFGQREYARLAQQYIDSLPG